MMKRFALCSLCSVLSLFAASSLFAQDDEDSRPMREVTLGGIESEEEPEAAPEDASASEEAKEDASAESEQPQTETPQAAPEQPAQPAAQEKSAFGTPKKKGPEEPRIVPFRVGRIYSAEITNKQPDIEQGDSEYDKPEWENPLWAEVIVQYDDTRALSRFDYTLVSSSGVEYPCMCVKVVSLRNPRIYSLKPDAWKIPGVNANNFYYLLFAVSPDEFKPLGESSTWPSQLIPMTFRCKFAPTKRLTEVPIGLRVLPDGSPFSKITSELSKGFCNLSLSELVNAQR